VSYAKNSVDEKKKISGARI